MIFSMLFSVAKPSTAGSEGRGFSRPSQYIPLGSQESEIERLHVYISKGSRTPSALSMKAIHLLAYQLLPAAAASISMQG